jgi:hypothetical protein
MVVDTGGWLSARKILFDPSAFGKPDYEADFHGYNGWPGYGI